MTREPCRRDIIAPSGLRECDIEYSPIAYRFRPGDWVVVNGERPMRVVDVKPSSKTQDVVVFDPSEWIA